MSRHATALALSTYLDEELEPRAVDELEEHLEECPACRERLRSMRRITSELSELTPYTPPPALAGELESRLLGLDRSEPWLARFEGSLKRWTPLSTLMPLFAILVAIAIIVFMLVDSSSEPRTGAGAGASTTEAASVGTVIRRVAGDRVFEERDAVWFEVGSFGEPDAVVDLREREVPEEFADFARLGATVQILIGEERVRIHYR